MKSFEKIRAIHTLRQADTLAKAVTAEDLDGNGDILFLKSPSDIGVCRNGGRRGTCFGPKALLAPLLACTLPADHLSSIPKIQMATVSCPKAEEKSFPEGQNFSISKISQSIENFSGKTIFHLGGGHDHIYPLLTALEKTMDYQHLKVLNLDAHLDTRIDNFAHSGTPFRQFSEKTKRDFTLYQLGIHPYSNGATNYDALPNGKMEILTPQGTQGITQRTLDILKKKIKLKPEDLLVLSLDCDVLHASFMEGVSAVNHNGMELETLESIFYWYKKTIKQQTSLIGIYEYNPIFDNLSQKGARSMASVIYHYMFNTQHS